ncbi:MAG: cyclic nucleotide-binding domain-containing protein [Anaerolineales bacterium]|nr:cyclic nucleotide-binding domain-containing protein [Anaerolineales bacterium]
MLSEDIKKLPFFQDLPVEQSSVLEELFSSCDFYTGSILFEQGDPADFLYLVISGEVVIHYKPDDGAKITVARVREGGIVGWSAALGNAFYTSTAECTDYSQLLRVRGDELRKLCIQCPELNDVILDRLAGVIAKRLRKSHKQVMSLLRQSLETNVRDYKEA